MPRPQMPKQPNPSNTANVPSTDFTKAQKQNVQQARADANTARNTTQRVEKMLRTPTSAPKPNKG